MKEISSKSMGEISIISKIKYHLTVFDKDVHFLCEIFNNSTCGTGLVSFNISIHVTLDDNEGNCLHKVIVLTFQYKRSICNSLKFKSQITFE